jgi:hypothetical protein
MTPVIVSRLGGCFGGGLERLIDVRVLARGHFCNQVGAAAAATSRTCSSVEG